MFQRWDSQVGDQVRRSVGEFDFRRTTDLRQHFLDRRNFMKYCLQLNIPSNTVDLRTREKITNENSFNNKRGRCFGLRSSQFNRTIGINENPEKMKKSLNDLESRWKSIKKEHRFDERSLSNSRGRCYKMVSDRRLSLNNDNDIKHQLQNRSTKPTIQDKDLKKSR